MTDAPSLEERVAALEAKPRWACSLCGCTDVTAIPSESGGAREVCSACGSNEFRSLIPPSPEWTGQLRNVLNYGTPGGVPGAP